MEKKSKHFEHEEDGMDLNMAGHNLHLFFKFFFLLGVLCLTVRAKGDPFKENIPALQNLGYPANSSKASGLQKDPSLTCWLKEEGQQNLEM